MSIKKISSREVYRNPWTRVREDVVERSNGERGVYGVIEKDPACIVIPLEETAEGDFLYLVEQFRYTVGEQSIEFPQGGWERADVDPEALARGELREETGLVAETMTRLARFQIAIGVMAQVQYAYLARGLKPGPTAPDAEEHDLVVHRVSVAEFEEMLATERIVDTSTAAAWAVYKLWREKQKAKTKLTTD
jgi:8-oxo-dGTP pyrophosphatase MutT (NUDIX family)